jgi:hypothetical protein
VKNNADGPADPANCPGTGCRLRDALAAASDGDTIDFDSSFFATPRTIALMSNALVVDKNVTISGPGLNRNQVYLLSISGANSTPNTPIPVLNIKNPAAQGIVQISGVAIQNGHADFDHGGGIFIREGSSLRLNKSQVSGNTAAPFGTGGIVNRGYLELIGCKVQCNTCTNGGGAR